MMAAPTNGRESYERCAGNALGKGAYGTVYKGRDRTNPDRLVALKEIRIPISDEGMPMNALREIGLLKQLDKSNHPNVVRYLLGVVRCRCCLHYLLQNIYLNKFIYKSLFIYNSLYNSLYK